MSLARLGLLAATLSCFACSPAADTTPSGGGGAGAATGGGASGGAAGGGAPIAGVSMGGQAGAVGAGGSLSGSPSGGSVAGGGVTAGGSAGSAGAGGSAGAVAALFSDDFEAATLGTAWVPRINGGGSFELSTAQKHGGAQSLHPKRNNGYSTLLAVEGAPVFPAPNNTFFGRVWLRVSGSPSTSKLSTQHLIWMEAGEVTNDTHEIRIGANLGYFQVNLFHNGEVDLRAPDAALTLDTWHCVEFEMGPDLLEIWLDSQHVDALSTKNWVEVGQGNGGVQASSPMSNWSPTYAAFRLGWELSSGDDNGDIFYDDVALGHARLGCQ